MTLKEMRTRMGYNQTELAALAGVNLRSLQDYEQGHKALSSAKGETLYRLSFALGASMEEILEGSGSMSAPAETQEERLVKRLSSYEKALQKRENNRILFPLIVSDKEVDMRRIYPTKQRIVKSVIDQLRLDSRVRNVRLFGSSITMRCNRESDLDFAVGLTDNSEGVKNEVSEEIQKCCEWGADILWMDRISKEDRVYEDIMKGLVLL